MKKIFGVALAALLAVSSAQAAFDLRVTEVWPGNVEGDDLSDDWFEVTNFGDMAWTAATDGNLYFEDDSADPARADLMSGIDSIAPGESVIFVDGMSDPDDGLNVFIWNQVWGPALTDAGKSIPQVGTYAGSGLSGTNGDAVALFLDANLDDVVEESELLLVQPHAGNFAMAGFSFDTNLNGTVTAPVFDDNDVQVGTEMFDGQFSTVAFGVVSGPNNDGEVAVASPGFLPVPEPSTLALVALALVGVVSNRR